MSRPFYRHQPELFPGNFGSAVRNASLLAPFWSNIDLTKGGAIYYQGYTSTSSPVFQRAMLDANNFTSLSNFMPLGVFVVTWLEVQSATATSKQSSTVSIFWPSNLSIEQNQP